MTLSEEILNRDILSINQDILTKIKTYFSKQKSSNKENLQNPNTPIFLAIAGGSSTGKTSQISEKVKEFLISSGYQADILALDTFQFGDDYLTKNWIREETQKYRYDHPNNTGLYECLDTLNTLKNGADQVNVPNFQFLHSKRVGDKIFKNTQIVILEGIYAFYKPLDDFDFEYKIYVQMPLYARLIRRYFRTVYQYQIIRPNSCLYEMLSSVRFAHNDFLKKQAKIADKVQDLYFDFTATVDRFKLKPKEGNQLVSLTQETALEEILKQSKSSSSNNSSNKMQIANSLEINDSDIKELEMSDALGTSGFDVQDLSVSNTDKKGFDYKFGDFEISQINISLDKIITGIVIWSFEKERLSMKIYEFEGRLFWILFFEKKIWEVAVISPNTLDLFRTADMLEV